MQTASPVVSRRADLDRPAEGDAIVTVTLDANAAAARDRRHGRHRRHPSGGVAAHLHPAARRVGFDTERDAPLLGIERRELGDPLAVLAEKSAQLLAGERLAVDRGLFLVVRELDRTNRRVGFARPQANGLLFHRDAVVFADPVAQAPLRVGRRGRRGRERR